MLYSDALELKFKHSNLQGHLILNGSLIIIKLFIAPINIEEFDSFMMSYSKHSYKSTAEIEKILPKKEVDVYVLYHEKGGSTKTKLLSEFIDTVIPLEELRSNVF